MTKSFKDNLKSGAKTFGYLVVLALLISAFSGDDSDDKDSEVQTAGANIKETEVSASQAADTPAEAETPEPTSEPTPEITPEEDLKSLDDAKADYATPVKSEEEDLEEEYQKKLAEQEEAEEEQSTTDDYDTSSSSTISDNDLAWITATTADTKRVSKDMTNLGNAASNMDVSGMTTYADRLYTSTNDAIETSDSYTVSSDLQPVQKEYRLGMVAYNWAALMCYDAIDALNYGDSAGSTESFEKATEFMDSGTEHITKCSTLLDEYTEEHS